MSELRRHDDWRDDGDDDLFDRDPLDDDDDDEEWTEEDESAVWMRSIMSKEIQRELAALDKRDLLDFLSDELDRLKFTEKTEMVVIGIDFSSQYVLELYNVREDSTVQMATGAGNIHSLVTGWIMQTLEELTVDLMYCDLDDLGPADLLDVSTSILLDVLDWKKQHGIPCLPGRDETLETDSGHEETEEEDD